MKCLVLGIEYDGSLYYGWQTQADKPTVQAALQAAFLQFTQEQITVHSAGRTDRGVHALEQIAHIHTNINRDPYAWVRAGNAILKTQNNHGIRILWAKYVPPNFHARSKAISREYVYYLYVGNEAPACFRQYIGHLTHNAVLNIKAIEETIQSFLGEHDFSSFRASQCQALTPIKNLQEIRIQNRHPYYAFHFKANAFLHHMVRNLMGLLLAVGVDKISPLQAYTILEAKNRRFAPPTFMPNGLFFKKINYDAEWGLDFENKQTIIDFLGF